MFWFYLKAKVQDVSVFFVMDWGMGAGRAVFFSNLSVYISYFVFLTSSPAILTLSHQRCKQRRWPRDMRSETTSVSHHYSDETSLCWSLILEWCQLKEVCHICCLVPEHCCVFWCLTEESSVKCKWEKSNLLHRSIDKWINTLIGNQCAFTLVVLYYLSSPCVKFIINIWTQQKYTSFEIQNIKNNIKHVFMSLKCIAITHTTKLFCSEKVERRHTVCGVQSAGSSSSVGAFQEPITLKSCFHVTRPQNDMSKLITLVKICLWENICEAVLACTLLYSEVYQSVMWMKFSFTSCGLDVFSGSYNSQFCVKNFFLNLRFCLFLGVLETICFKGT